MGFQYFLFVGLGGATGSILRASLSVFLPSLSVWGTAIANLLGALMIGLLLRILNGSTDPIFMKAFWIVGFCGGFTTFSTFGVDLIDLINAGSWWKASCYAGINFIGTVLFIFLGYRIGNILSMS